MKSRPQQPLGRDDVDALEPGDSRQQTEVGGGETVHVGNPVADGHDDVRQGIRCRRGNQMFAKRVLVDRVRRVQPTAILVERRGKKSRLLEQPDRATILVAAQPLRNQLFEPPNALPLASQLIVKPQHLRDETGTHVVGWRRSRSMASIAAEWRTTSRSNAVSTRRGAARRAFRPA